MSISSTTGNYGGRVQDNQQGVKQFYVGTQGVIWAYKRLNGLVTITPTDSKRPVLINNDLIVTGSIYNSSDERLKDNIRDINEEELNHLFTLNPIHFNYKNDMKKTHYGFLAQEVEKQFPEFVTNNVDGYKVVNYQEFIPLMLSKMRTMQAEIDELKEQINK